MLFTRFTATDFALKSLMRREETRRDEMRWGNWTEERRGLSPCQRQLVNINKNKLSILRTREKMDIEK